MTLLSFRQMTLILLLFVNGFELNNFNGKWLSFDVKMMKTCCYFILPYLSTRILSAKITPQVTITEVNVVR
jgi:hypothetical protein